MARFVVGLGDWVVRRTSGKTVHLNVATPVGSTRAATYPGGAFLGFLGKTRARRHRGLLWQFLRNLSKF